MTRLVRTALWATLALAVGLAAGAAAAETGLPPVLDRELFFGNPEIAAAQLSPDGQFIAFLKPWKDTRNIYVKKTAEAFDKARLLTAESKRPIPAFFWTRDSRLILYVKDNDGDENFNVYAVNPADTPAPGAEVPAARNLTDLKGVRAAIYDVPKTDPDIIYVGLNDLDKAWHDLYRVRISTGDRTLLRKNTERLSGWSFARGSDSTSAATARSTRSRARACSLRLFPASSARPISRSTPSRITYRWGPTR